MLPRCHQVEGIAREGLVHKHAYAVRMSRSGGAKKCDTTMETTDVGLQLELKGFTR